MLRTLNQTARAHSLSSVSLLAVLGEEGRQRSLGSYIQCVTWRIGVTGMGQDRWRDVGTPGVLACNSSTPYDASLNTVMIFEKRRLHVLLSRGLVIIMSGYNTKDLVWCKVDEANFD